MQTDGTVVKPCVVCGADCANRPRTKDRHGRYYCRPCYDRLLVKARAQSARQRTPATARRLPPKPAPSTVSTFGDDLLELDGGAAVAVAERPCPGCGHALPTGAVLCTACGYNLQTGSRVVVAQAAPAPKASAAPAQPSAISGLLVSPLALSGIQALIILGLFILAKSNPELAPVYMAVSGLYVLAIQIWAVVCGFREGVVTGLLCLFLPGYILYFVFAKCGSPYVRGAYLVLILGLVLRFALVMMAPVELEE